MELVESKTPPITRSTWPSQDAELLKVEPEAKSTLANWRMDLDSDTENTTAYITLSDDEDEELDETEDRIIAPEYAVKEEFSQEIYESHEKNVWLFELMQIIYPGQP